MGGRGRSSLLIHLSIIHILKYTNTLHNHARTHTHAYTRVLTNTNVHVHTHTHTHTHTYTRTHTHTHKHPPTQIKTHTNKQTNKNTHTYTHVHTWNIGTHIYTCDEPISQIANGIFERWSTTFLFSNALELLILSSECIFHPHYSRKLQFAGLQSNVTPSTC
jgi:hypothetical protein